MSIDPISIGVNAAMEVVKQQITSPEGQEIAKAAGKELCEKVAPAAKEALSALPSPIKAGAASGAFIGSALGPIGTFMGAASGAVIGTVFAAATGMLD